MPRPNKPFSEWKQAELVALTADPPAVETARLDFKAECNVLSGDKEKARRDLLTDVSAMANGAGGALLIGVRQTGNPNAPPSAARIDGVADVERLKKTIDELVNTHLDVRPGPLTHHVVQNGAEPPVLIVEIPANTYCLSMVTYNNVNQFWIRRGTDNRLMTTDEIEYKFGQFAKVRQDASDELRDIHLLMLNTHLRPLVWFAAVPMARRRDHVPVNVQEMTSLISEGSYFDAFPEQKTAGTRNPFIFTDCLTPCPRGMSVSQARRRSAVFEIRRDGVVLLAMMPPTDNLAVGPVPDRPEEGKPKVIPLWTIYEPLLSGLHLFADLEDRYAFGKVALVQAGLMGVEGRRAFRGSTMDHFSAPSFSEGDIALDAIMLDEHWKPRQVFDEWSQQIANALGKEERLVCKPWVK